MIVFDSSTLILLARISILETSMLSYRKKVVIPEKVRSEVCVKGREETPLINKMIESRTVQILKVRGSNKQIKKLMDDFSIDCGEAESLLLALQEGADIVATDDRNAIRACKMLNVKFVTAVSFLVRLVEKELIKEDEALLKLKKLHSLGRYSEAIMKDAAKRIKGGV